MPHQIFFLYDTDSLMTLQYKDQDKMVQCAMQINANQCAIKLVTLIQNVSQ